MMEHSLPVAADVAANHCPELIKAEQPAIELEPAFRELGEGLAKPLRAALLEHLQLKAEVYCAGVEATDNFDLGFRVGPLAANSLHLIAGTPYRMLMSIDARIVLAELDRTFGGDGDPGDHLPETFSMSADLLSRSIEQNVLDCLLARLEGCTLEPLSRHCHLEQLAPFTDEMALHAISIEVEKVPGDPWKISFVVEAGGLPHLFPALAAGGGGKSRRAPARPLDKPYADLPLSIAARLVDMKVPLARLAGLAPGTVIPVSVAREVPLRIGRTIVAHGSVGELDDQIALQISRTSFAEKEQ